MTRSGHDKVRRIVLGGIVIVLLGCGRDNDEVTSSPQEATTSSTGASSAAAASSTTVEPRASSSEEFIELARQLPGLNAGDVPSFELQEREARATVVLSGTVAAVEPTTSTLSPEGLEATLDVRSVVIQLTVEAAYVGPASGGDDPRPPLPDTVTIPIDSVTPYNSGDIDRMEAQILQAAPIGARAILYVEPRGAAPRALFLEGSGGNTVALDPLVPLPPFEDMLRRIVAFEPIPVG